MNKPLDKLKSSYQEAKKELNDPAATLQDILVNTQTGECTFIWEQDKDKTEPF